MNTDSQSFF